MSGKTSPPPDGYPRYPMFNSKEDYGQSQELPPTQEEPNRDPQFPPQNATPPMGWFERNQRNKPQSNSVGSACVVFVSGGMNMAWSFDRTMFTQIDMTMHMRLSWFVSAIIGAIIGAVLIHRVLTKPIYLSASALVFLDGILFLSLPRNFIAIIIARYIDGFATGLIFVPVLVLAGEEAIKEFRGMIATCVEVMCFNLGVYLQMVYSACYAPYNETDFSAIQLHGILSIIYGGISLLFSYYLLIESPIYYLTKNQEELAIDALRRLQRPFVVNSETYVQLDEEKRYLSQNQEMTPSESFVAGLSALFKLTLYRGLNALNFSFLVYYSFISVSMQEYGDSGLIWAPIVFSTLRWMGSLFACFSVDSVGRKLLLLIGALLCGTLALTLGGLNVNLRFIGFPKGTKAIFFIFFAFQLFAGVFITPSSAYLSEAFPLAAKPYYILITFIVEMLVQIIVLCCSTASSASFSAYFITTGILYLTFFVFSIFCMPHTKKLPLWEAQEKFRKFVSRS